MTAYYNEHDPHAAAWLRELIAAGHIAPGIVDERSIEDVHPSDLDGFTQCHFFAGIGGWSYALRLAGWSDDRPVWTGSCPCQPFSTAGQGAGFADERHLWPAFHHLIKKCKPAIVLGEQVAGKDAEPWLDLVQTDMEALGYAFGCVPFPSAGVGAPHIRDRVYWVGHANQPGSQGYAGHGGAAGRSGPGGPIAAPGISGGVADADSGAGRKGRAVVRGWADRGNAQPRAGSCGGGVLDRLADNDSTGRSAWGEGSPAMGYGEAAESDRGFGERPGPVNGFWANADWLLCRDGKWRPVEPGTFPLADGVPARVVRLRGYGNAINAEAARVFAEVVMEAAS